MAGCAGITMPGLAPLTPVSQEPSVLTLPLSYSLVSSPKYQTAPSRSCAYQSQVSSTTWPFELATSWTTVVVTPAMSFVFDVTVTTMSWSRSSLVCR